MELMVFGRQSEALRIVYPFISTRLLQRFLRPVGLALGDAMSEPMQIIQAALHSAFVKYPKEDDPDFSHHWIKPEEAAHLAKVMMLELEAAGFQIVKRSS
jgi:hypothetical protein